MTAFFGFILVFVVSVFPGAAIASAQPCETRPLAFGVFQGGELEPTDCRFPADSCSDCFGPVPGDYWTIEAAAGDLIAITLQGTTGRYGPGRIGPDLRVFDPGGQSVGDWWAHACESDFGGPTVVCAGRSLKAETTGTFRLLVIESGYMSVRYGGYAIRARHVTSTCPEHSQSRRRAIE